MHEALLIPLRQADVGRRLDRAIAVLVLLLIMAAWLAEPGQPMRFAALAALLGLSWLVPRLLNARRRRENCSPASLCAQARVVYRQPLALAFTPEGGLQVQWDESMALVSATELRILHLGSLLHLAFSTPDPVMLPGSAMKTLESVSSVPITSGSMGDTAFSHAHATGDDVTSTEAVVGALSNPTVQPSAMPTATRHGSCLLWMSRLSPAESAALRQWLLWRKRAGR